MIVIVTINKPSLLHVAVFIINLLLFSEATEIQEIRLDKHAYGNKQLKVDVIRDKPLNIILENLNVVNIICLGDDVDEKCDTKHLSDNCRNFGNNTFLFKIPVVHNTMSTKWNCTIVYDMDKSISTLLEVRVKGAKRVHVDIGGFEPTFAETDLSTPGYDGVYTHEYEEDEFIDYTCSIIEKGEIRLRYNNANDNLVFERPQVAIETQVRFQKSMRAHDHNSYVDCTYFTSVSETGHQQEFTYRTVFIFKNQYSRKDFGVFSVIVNGSKLVRQRSNSSNADLYRYMFINGTTLDVTCKLKHKDTHGFIDIKDNEGIEWQDITPRDLSGQRRLLINTNNLTMTKFTCALGAKVAHIQLVPDLHRAATILGLPTSGIAYQYSLTSYEWEIHYAMTSDEALGLACMTSGNWTPSWDGKNSTVISSDGINYVTDTFETNNNIVCYSSKIHERSQKITVVLHQKLGQVLSDTGYEIPIYIGYAIGALVIIVLIVLLVLRWTKKRNPRAVQCPYENINEDNNPIPPFPPQWNNNYYAYIKQDNDSKTITSNEYTYIQPENILNKNEHVMEENSLYITNTKPDYAVAYKVTNDMKENLYTEIDEHLNKKKSEYAEPYEDHEIKSVPSSSCESNNHRQMQREDSNNGYNSLLRGDQSYINFQSDVRYSNLCARESSINVY